MRSGVNLGNLQTSHHFDSFSFIFIEVPGLSWMPSLVWLFLWSLWALCYCEISGLAAPFTASRVTNKSGRANPPQALGEAILQQRNPLRAERPSRKHMNFKDTRNGEITTDFEHLNSIVPVVSADTKGRRCDPRGIFSWSSYHPGWSKQQFVLQDFLYPGDVRNIPRWGPTFYGEPGRLQFVRD